MPEQFTGAFQPEYIPTLEEIAEACAEIQKNWSEEERRERAGGFRRIEWFPPIMHRENIRPERSESED